MVARGAVAALLWAAASATTMRDVCLNKNFEQTLDGIDDPWLLEPHNALRDEDVVMGAIDGRHALEIGGPTPWAKHIYARVASMDNFAQFADQAHSRFEHADGGAFAPDGDAIIGRTVVGDAANVTAAVAPGAYDLLFASHVLEHMLDPIGALKSWDAALAPGGVLLLMLPWKDPTFDHLRAPNTLDQLAQKHVRYGAGRDEAALLVDFEQTVRAIDLALDWGFPPGAQASDLRRRTLASPQGREQLHWHVFDFHLLRELFACLGYRVLAMDLLAPFHQIIVGVKDDALRGGAPRAVASEGRGGPPPTPII